MENNFDVIIIGGGAGGISAALWCDDLGLKALLLEAGAEIGGQLLRVYNPIKNHLGAETENGREMRDIFLKQLDRRKLDIRLNTRVEKFEPQENRIITDAGEQLTAAFFVIATGVRRRKLNVSSEKKFRARGILESGARDPNQAQGKRVCIVGGGDAALENALILAPAAAQIYIIHRRAELSARAEFIKKVAANKKINVLTETILTEFNGAENLESVTLQNLKTLELFNLEIDFVLPRIGVEPNSEIFHRSPGVDKIEVDKNGYFKVDSNCQTALANVFAVGDAANPISPTISTAVGMGATAIKAIFDFYSKSRK